MREAERRLVRGVTAIKDAVRGWVDGYSKQDILNNQRLASGNITPEDRINFREATIARYEKKAASSSHAPSIITFNLTIEVMKALPEKEVDELIRNQATFNLGLWVRPQQK